MKEIYFATSNEGKVKTLKKSFSDFDIDIVHEPFDFDEPRSENLRRIAKQKVLDAYREIHNPTLAQDAGFYINSLNGFPKTLVNHSLETIGMEGILKLLEGKDRKCEFKNCLAYFQKDFEEPKYFESTVKGSISAEKRGKIPDYAWSKLFLIFIPEGREKTLAEMSRREFKDWRSERRKHSFTTKSAEWIEGKTR
ncbi:MAG: non-canonical purine NTP pyrophosphatase [Candidatus Aenigmatarchaeota archaeon]